MSVLTKERRQEIVREFAVRHNGQFDPRLFFMEVQEKGEAHPAHVWFTWDVAEAAYAHQIEQARSFARDLRVSFRVEEVIAPHSVRVRETPMPMVLSPLAGRNKGGGYVLTDPDDPEHMHEHRRQAAKTLTQWMERYAAALADAKVKTADIDKIVGKLEPIAPRRVTGRPASPQPTA